MKKDNGVQKKQNKKNADKREVSRRSEEKVRTATLIERNEQKSKRENSCQGGENAHVGKGERHLDHEGGEEGIEEVKEGYKKIKN